MVRIGVISDTHGLLRPEASTFLRGCDHIVHGGDVGKPEVLAALAALAPVIAVRGNVDRGEWATALPDTRRVTLAGVCLYMLHDLAELDIDPVADGIDVVVSGHSHRPLATRRDGVLYLNPGSAGPRRFKLPVSVAEIIVDGRTIESRIVVLV